MKNYYEVDTPAWPEREILSYEEIVNTFDNNGPACRATLSCGHTCVLTGTAITKYKSVQCKYCGENNDTRTTS